MVGPKPKHRAVGFYSSPSFSRYANSDLPTDLYGMGSVPYGDTFLLVGGSCMSACDPNLNSRDILEYEPDSETWLKREEEMAMGRLLFDAVLVEDSIVDCV